MVRDQMQPVILVEVADLDQDAAARSHDASEVDVGRSARPAHRWGALSAALVAVLVVGGVASVVRSQDRAARLAALPGVLAPVDMSLHELWRIPQRGSSQFERLGADVVVFGPDNLGDVAVIAVDGTTGEQRWALPLPTVTSTGNVWCVAGGDGEPERPAHLACVVVEEVEVDAEGDIRPHDDAVRLLVLDARTGAKVAERALATANVGLASFGTDLITAEVRADGHAHVTRADLLTGRPRWSFRSTTSVGDATDGGGWVSPLVQNGVILARGPVTWAFAPDGTVLGEWRWTGRNRGSWLEISVVPDGRFAVGQTRGVGFGAVPYGTVSIGGARDGFRIPGPVLPLVVDDGTASDVLFTAVASDSGIVALDSTTGERLWAWDPDHFSGDAMVLDTRFITVAGRELTAFDARSGQHLWTVQAPMGNHAQQVLTDGHVLLLPMFDRAFGPQLTAIDPADGRRRWSVPLPANVTHLSVAHGRLLAVTDRDLVALG